MNPYITYQDPQKLFATTQGTGMQDQFHQQAMQQMAQLASQAGQSAPSANSINALSLAKALRGSNAVSNGVDTANAFMPWTQMNIGNQYGTDPYSEQSRMLAMQERGF